MGGALTGEPGFGRTAPLTVLRPWDEVNARNGITAEMEGVLASICDGLMSGRGGPER